MRKLVHTIRRETYYPVKRLVKSLLKNHVYVARHGLAKGFKVTGDLGFLTRPTFEYENEFVAGLDLTGQIVYDIGGHIGLFTLYFSRAVGPQGKVITFEPNPETFRTLRRNVELNCLTNVQLINAGLGAERQTIELLYGDYDGGLGTLDEARQSELMRSHKGMVFRRASVPVYALDDLIREQALPDPTFVKIDVEEYEYPVLRGMRDLLSRVQPTLLVEVHGAHNADILANARRIAEHLIACGYGLREITHGNAVTLDSLETVLTGMTLYCRPA